VSDSAQLQAAFAARFGGQPTWLASAPGRVNLIGDHTDYNQGFVLPMAIERRAVVALRARADKRVILHSINFGETAEFDLDDLQHSKGWVDYAAAVLSVAARSGFAQQGWEGVVASDVPIGSGLSSSAAFELALARACCAASAAEWRPTRMARLMQDAENGWVGVASGIMDPLIAAIAEPGRAALIDCRDLSVRHVAIPAGASVVIMNTMKKRGLVDSAYNERRRQCEQAAAAFGVNSLRELSLEQLAAGESKLDPLAYRRARHVLTENERVLGFARKMEAGDLAAAGECMNRSHASLRDDYEVSCVELDAIVGLTQSQPGCFGARMTGAGFGGCAVALVQKGSEAEFEQAVAAGYGGQFGIVPELIRSAPAAGAELLRLA
jgi:galactokinase